MWGEREEKYGDVLFRVQAEKVLMDYPFEEREKILRLIIEWLNKNFEKNKWGSLTKSERAKLEKGEIIELKNLGNLKIKVGEKQAAFFAKNYRVTEELLTYLQQNI